MCVAVAVVVAVVAVDAVDAVLVVLVVDARAVVALDAYARLVFMRRALCYIFFYSVVEGRILI